MKTNLKSRLSLSYALVALVCVFLISILSNFFLEKQFKVYTISNQQRKNYELANLINKQYLKKGSWNKESIENIGVNAIEQGMIIKLKDIKGEVIWDATLHNNGLCKQMLDKMAESMNEFNPNWDGNYEISSYPIYDDGEEIAKLEIGYYGPFYYTDDDIEFIGTLNKLLIGVGIVALIFALLLGIIMSKYLCEPIVRVIKTAENISDGQLKNRINEKSTINKISLLITTINNLAENLEKQELLRKRITSDVAHELRTPLSTLQGYIEGMIDGVWNADIYRLQNCHEEIIRIIELVGNLENLTKYENNINRLIMVRYDMSQQLQAIIFNLKAQFEGKNIKVYFDCEKVEILADKNKISQVLINILTNAFKYTKDNGEIYIKIFKKDNFIVTSIKDTGIGISKEDLPYIFERFYRADKSRNRLTGGSGIGLTIAKTIIDLHKGKIEVSSSLNMGCEFNVFIPK